MPRKNPPDDMSGSASNGDEFQAPRTAPAASTEAPAAQSPLFGDLGDHVPTVRRVIAREHDVIMFMFPGKLTIDQVSRLREHVREAFPSGTNILIMSDGVNVEVIGKQYDFADSAIIDLQARFETSGPAGSFDAAGFANAILALAAGEPTVAVAS